MELKLRKHGENVAQTMAVPPPEFREDFFGAIFERILQHSAEQPQPVQQRRLQNATLLVVGVVLSQELDRSA